MLNKDGYLALTHIYDAAINLGRWRRALDAAAKSMDAKAIALLIRNPEPKAKDLQMVNSTYLNFGKSPWGLYYALRLSKLQNPDWNYLSRQPVHTPTLDTSTGLSSAELDSRADYKMLRKKIGVGRRLGVRLNTDKIWFDAVSIAFDANVPTIPDTAITDTKLLLPHLTKAVEIGRTFALLKSQYKAALSALDHVKTGMAIALPSGEIIVQNSEAARILDLKDGLTKSAQGHLHCDQPDQTAELFHALSLATQTAKGEHTAHEHLIAVKRPSGQSPFLLDVSPLRDSKGEIDTALQGALITIIDPDRVPYLRMDRFIALYSLTPAEAEVCRLIIQGLSVNDIAEHRSTTPTTAKNQVAAILQKIGVSRRLELIRLVIRVLPPVG